MLTQHSERRAEEAGREEEAVKPITIAAMIITHNRNHRLAKPVQDKDCQFNSSKMPRLVLVAMPAAVTHMPLGVAIRTMPPCGTLR